MHLQYPINDRFDIETHVTGHMLQTIRQIDFSSVRRKFEEVYRVAPDNCSEDYMSPRLDIITKPDGRAFIDMLPLKKMQFVTMDNEELVEVDLPDDMFPDEIEFVSYKKMTMKDIDFNIVTGKYVGVDNFISAVIHDGIHNVRLRRFSTGHEYGLKEISFKIHEGYKIGVYNLNDPNNTQYDSFEYYLTDLLNLFGIHSAAFFQILPSVGDQSWDHTREYFRDRGIMV